MALHRKSGVLSLTLPSTQACGYSCQTVLARVVNEFLHPGEYWCWFSEVFNPDDGGNSSNPCWRYQTFDKAVRTNDVSDAYVRDAREKLTNALNLAISAEYDLLHPPTEKDNVNLAKNILAIRHAGLEYLRPQVWRINLARIKGRYSSGHQYHHEHLIEKLKWTEFEIIVA